MHPVIRGFDMHLPVLEFGDECFMFGKDLEYAFASGERRGNGFSVKEIFANFCNRKMECFHGRQCYFTSSIEPFI